MHLIDFSRTAVEVAPLLLGCEFSSARFDQHRQTWDVVSIRVTEVEAYNGSVDSEAPDPGSHCYRGMTPRNKVMFAAGGVLYTYFNYGMHWAVNVVCGPAGLGSAVLIRAGEVVTGVATAKGRRPACRCDVDLARGPGRLAQAAGIGSDGYGIPLEQTDAKVRGATLPYASNAGFPGEAPKLRVFLRARSTTPGDIATSPRVGVRGPGGGRDYPWRFYLEHDPTVSNYRPATPRTA